MLKFYWSNFIYSPDWSAELMTPKGAIVLEVPLHEIWIHTTVAIWEKDMVAVIFSAQP